MEEDRATALAREHQDTALATSMAPTQQRLSQSPTQQQRASQSPQRASQMSPQRASQAAAFPQRASHAAASRQRASLTSQSPQRSGSQLGLTPQRLSQKEVKPSAVEEPTPGDEPPAVESKGGWFGGWWGGFAEPVETAVEEGSSSKASPVEVETEIRRVLVVEAAHGDAPPERLSGHVSTASGVSPGSVARNSVGRDSPGARGSTMSGTQGLVDPSLMAGSQNLIGGRGSVGSREAMVSESLSPNRRTSAAEAAQDDGRPQQRTSGIQQPAFGIKERTTQMSAGRSPQRASTAQSQQRQSQTGDVGQPRLSQSPSQRIYQSPSPQQRSSTASMAQSPQQGASMAQFHQRASMAMAEQDNGDVDNVGYGNMFQAEMTEVSMSQQMYDNRRARQRSSAAETVPSGSQGMTDSSVQLTDSQPVLGASAAEAQKRPSAAQQRRSAAQHRKSNVGVSQAVNQRPSAVFMPSQRASKAAAAVVATQSESPSGQSQSRQLGSATQGYRAQQNIMVSPRLRGGSKLKGGGQPSQDEKGSLRTDSQHVDPAVVDMHASQATEAQGTESMSVTQQQMGRVQTIVPMVGEEGQDGMDHDHGDTHFWQNVGNAPAVAVDANAIAFQGAQSQQKEGQATGGGQSQPNGGEQSGRGSQSSGTPGNRQSQSQYPGVQQSQGVFQRTSMHQSQTGTGGRSQPMGQSRASIVSSRSQPAVQMPVRTEQTIATGTGNSDQDASFWQNVQHAPAVGTHQDFGRYQSQAMGQSLVQSRQMGQSSGDRGIDRRSQSPSYRQQQTVMPEQDPIWADTINAPGRNQDQFQDAALQSQPMGAMEGQSREHSQRGTIAVEEGQRMMAAGMMHAQGDDGAEDGEINFWEDVQNGKGFPGDASNLGGDIPPNNYWSEEDVTGRRSAVPNQSTSPQSYSASGKKLETVRFPEPHSLESFREISAVVENSQSTQRVSQSQGTSSANMNFSMVANRGSEAPRPSTFDREAIGMDSESMGRGLQSINPEAMSMVANRGSEANVSTLGDSGSPNSGRNTMQIGANSGRVLNKAYTSPILGASQPMGGTGSNFGPASVTVDSHGTRGKMPQQQQELQNGQFQQVQSQQVFGVGQQQQQGQMDQMQNADQPQQDQPFQQEAQQQQGGPSVSVGSADTLLDIEGLIRDLEKKIVSFVARNTVLKRDVKTEIADCIGEIEDQVISEKVEGKMNDAFKNGKVNGAMLQLLHDEKKFLAKDVAHKVIDLTRSDMVTRNDLEETVDRVVERNIQTWEDKLHTELHDKVKQMARYELPQMLEDSFVKQHIEKIDLVESKTNVVTKRLGEMEKHFQKQMNERLKELETRTNDRLLQVDRMEEQLFTESNRWKQASEDFQQEHQSHRAKLMELIPLSTEMDLLEQKMKKLTNDVQNLNREDEDHVSMEHKLAARIRVCDDEWMVRHSHMEGLYKSKTHQFQEQLTELERKIDDMARKYNRGVAIGGAMGGATGGDGSPGSRGSRSRSPGGRDGGAQVMSFTAVFEGMQDADLFNLENNGATSPRSLTLRKSLKQMHDVILEGMEERITDIRQEMNRRLESKVGVPDLESNSMQVLEELKNIVNRKLNVEEDKRLHSIKKMELSIDERMVSALQEKLNLLECKHSAFIKRQLSTITEGLQAELNTQQAHYKDMLEHQSDRFFLEVNKKLSSNTDGLAVLEEKIEIAKSHSDKKADDKIGICSQKMDTCLKKMEALKQELDEKVEDTGQKFRHQVELSKRTAEELVSNKLTLTTRKLEAMKAALEEVTIYKMDALSSRIVQTKQTMQEIVLATDLKLQEFEDKLLQSGIWADEDKTRQLVRKWVRPDYRHSYADAKHERRPSWQWNTAAEKQAGSGGVGVADSDINNLPPEEWEAREVAKQRRSELEQRKSRFMQSDPSQFDGRGMAPGMGNPMMSPGGGNVGPDGMCPDGLNASPTTSGSGAGNPRQTVIPQTSGGGITAFQGLVAKRGSYLENVLNNPGKPIFDQLMDDERFESKLKEITDYLQQLISERLDFSDDALRQKMEVIHNSQKQTLEAVDEKVARSLNQVKRVSGTVESSLESKYDLSTSKVIATNQKMDEIVRALDDRIGDLEMRVVNHVLGKSGGVVGSGGTSGGATMVKPGSGGEELYAISQQDANGNIITKSVDQAIDDINFEDDVPSSKQQAVRSILLKQQVPIFEQLLADPRFNGRLQSVEEGLEKMVEKTESNLKKRLDDIDNRIDLELIGLRGASEQSAQNFADLESKTITLEAKIQGNFQKFETDIELLDERQLELYEGTTQSDKSLNQLHEKLEILIEELDEKMVETWQGLKEVEETCNGVSKYVEEQMAGKQQTIAKTNNEVVTGDGVAIHSTAVSGSLTLTDVGGKGFLPNLVGSISASQRMLLNKQENAQKEQESLASSQSGRRGTKQRGTLISSNGGAGGQRGTQMLNVGPGGQRGTLITGSMVPRRGSVGDGVKARSEAYSLQAASLFDKLSEDRRFQAKFEGIYNFLHSEIQPLIHRKLSSDLKDTMQSMLDEKVGNLKEGLALIKSATDIMSRVLNSAQGRSAVQLETDAAKFNTLQECIKGPDAEQKVVYPPEAQAWLSSLARSFNLGDNIGGKGSPSTKNRPGSPSNRNGPPGMGIAEGSGIATAGSLASKFEKFQKHEVGQFDAEESNKTLDFFFLQMQIIKTELEQARNDHNDFVQETRKAAELSEDLMLNVIESKFRDSRKDMEVSMVQQLSDFKVEQHANYQNCTQNIATVQDSLGSIIDQKFQIVRDIVHNELKEKFGQKGLSFEQEQRVLDICRQSEASIRAHCDRSVVTAKSNFEERLVAVITDTQIQEKKKILDIVHNQELPDLWRRVTEHMHTELDAHAGRFKSYIYNLASGSHEDKGVSNFFDNLISAHIQERVTELTKETERFEWRIRKEFNDFRKDSHGEFTDLRDNFIPFSIKEKERELMFNIDMRFKGLGEELIDLRDRYLNERIEEAKVLICDEIVNRLMTDEILEGLSSDDLLNLNSPRQQLHAQILSAENVNDMKHRADMLRKSNYKNSRSSSPGRRMSPPPTDLIGFTSNVPGGGASGANGVKANNNGNDSPQRMLFYEESPSKNGLVDTPTGLAPNPYADDISASNMMNHMNGNDANPNSPKQAGKSGNGKTVERWASAPSLGQWTQHKDYPVKDKNPNGGMAEVMKHGRCSRSLSPVARGVVGAVRSTAHKKLISQIASRLKGLEDLISEKDKLVKKEMTALRENYIDSRLKNIRNEMEQQVRLTQSHLEIKYDTGLRQDLMKKIADCCSEVERKVLNEILHNNQEYFLTLVVDSPQLEKKASTMIAAHLDSMSFFDEMKTGYSVLKTGLEKKISVHDLETGLFEKFLKRFLFFQAASLTAQNNGIHESTKGSQDVHPGSGLSTITNIPGGGLVASGSPLLFNSQVNSQHASSNVVSPNKITQSIMDGQDRLRGTDTSLVKIPGLMNRSMGIAQNNYMANNLLTNEVNADGTVSQVTGGGGAHPLLLDLLQSQMSKHYDPELPRKYKNLESNFMSYQRDTAEKLEKERLEMHLAQEKRFEALKASLLAQFSTQYRSTIELEVEKQWMHVLKTGNVGAYHSSSDGTDGVFNGSFAQQSSPSKDGVVFASDPGMSGNSGMPGNASTINQLIFEKSGKNPWIQKTPSGVQIIDPHLEQAVKKLVMTQFNGELFDQKLENFAENFRFQVQTREQKYFSEFKQERHALEKAILDKVELQLMKDSQESTANLKSELRRVEEVLGLKIDTMLSEEAEVLDRRLKKVESSVHDQMLHFKTVTLEKKVEEQKTQLKTEIGLMLDEFHSVVVHRRICAIENLMRDEADRTQGWKEEIQEAFEARIDETTAQLLKEIDNTVTSKWKKFLVDNFSIAPHKLGDMGVNMIRQESYFGKRDDSKNSKNSNPHHKVSSSGNSTSIFGGGSNTSGSTYLSTLNLRSQLAGNNTLSTASRNNFSPTGQSSLLGGGLVVGLRGSNNSLNRGAKDTRRRFSDDLSSERKEHGRLFETERTNNLTGQKYTSPESLSRAYESKKGNRFQTSMFGSGSSKMTGGVPDLWPATAQSEERGVQITAQLGSQSATKMSAKMEAQSMQCEPSIQQPDTNAGARSASASRVQNSMHASQKPEITSRERFADVVPVTGPVRTDLNSSISYTVADPRPRSSAGLHDVLPISQNRISDAEGPSEGYDQQREQRGSMIRHSATTEGNPKVRQSRAGIGIAAMPGSPLRTAALQKPNPQRPVQPLRSSVQNFPSEYDQPFVADDASLENPDSAQQNLSIDSFYLDDTRQSAALGAHPNHISDSMAEAWAQEAVLEEAAMEAEKRNGNFIGTAGPGATLMGASQTNTSARVSPLTATTERIAEELVAMEISEAVAVLNSMDAENAAVALEGLPEARQEQILEFMAADNPVEAEAIDEQLEDMEGMTLATPSVTPNYVRAHGANRPSQANGADRPSRANRNSAAQANQNLGNTESQNLRNSTEKGSQNLWNSAAEVNRSSQRRSQNLTSGLSASQQLAAERLTAAQNRSSQRASVNAVEQRTSMAEAAARIAGLPLDKSAGTSASTTGMTAAMKNAMASRDRGSTTRNSGSDDNLFLGGDFGPGASIEEAAHDEEEQDVIKGGDDEGSDRAVQGQDDMGAQNDQDGFGGQLSFGTASVARGSTAMATSSGVVTGSNRVAGSIQNAKRSSGSGTGSDSLGASGNSSVSSILKGSGGARASETAGVGVVPSSGLYGSAGVQQRSTQRSSERGSRNDVDASFAVSALRGSTAEAAAEEEPGVIETDGFDDAADDSGNINGSAAMNATPNDADNEAEMQATSPKGDKTKDAPKATGVFARSQQNQQQGILKIQKPTATSDQSDFTPLDERYELRNIGRVPASSEQPQPSRPSLAERKSERMMQQSRERSASMEKGQHGSMIEAEQERPSMAQAAQTEVEELFQEQEAQNLAESAAPMSIFEGAMQNEAAKRERVSAKGFRSSTSGTENLRQDPCENDQSLQSDPTSSTSSKRVVANYQGALADDNAASLEISMTLREGTMNAGRTSKRPSIRSSGRRLLAADAKHRAGSVWRNSGHYAEDGNPGDAGIQVEPWRNSEVQYAEDRRATVTDYNVRVGSVRRNDEPEVSRNKVTGSYSAGSHSAARTSRSHDGMRISQRSSQSSDGMRVFQRCSQSPLRTSQSPETRESQMQVRESQGRVSRSPSLHSEEMSIQKDPSLVTSATE